MKELEGKRITLWLKKPKFRYRGTVISVTDDFLRIHDEVDGIKRFIATSNIASVDEADEGGKE